MVNVLSPEVDKSALLGSGSEDGKVTSGLGFCLRENGAVAAVWDVVNLLSPEVDELVLMRSCKGSISGLS